MRFVLLSASALTLATLFACSTFSDGADEDPAPVVDAGSDTSPSETTCTPLVVDPAAPQTCTADFANDSQNCGECGRACVGSTCVGGRCSADKVTEPLKGFAIDGTTVYGQVGFDIVRADLTATPPIATEPFFTGILGDVTRLGIYNGELYASTTTGQYVITIATKAQRENEQIGSVTTEKRGIFFPGAPSYYLFTNDQAKETLARIDAQNQAALKNADRFEPLFHAGADIYWTDTLSGGAKIFGPWDSDKEPFANVGKPVDAFIVDGSTLFFAAAGYVTRVDRGATTSIVKLAIESGSGVAFAVDGPDLFYAVKRETSEVRYFLYRIDKCAGGRPHLLFDINVPILDIFFIDAEHVMVNTVSGIYRARR